MSEHLSVALLGTFESLGMGPSFARGRRDERAGHVRSLTVSGSLVVALVRGPEDPVAFRARVAVRSFGASEWGRVEQDLVREARFTADLLAGRMPAGIGALFAGAGLSLVPLSLDEVAMDCTCERWPMPCVHLTAALYALARRLEEDPFEVFAWRGRHRDELLMHLRELRGAYAVESGRGSAGAVGRGSSAAGGRAAGGSSGAGDPAGGSDAAGGPEGGAGAADANAFAGATGGAGDAAHTGGAWGGRDAAGGGGDTHTSDARAGGDSGADGRSEDAAAADLVEHATEIDFFWGVEGTVPIVPAGPRPGAVSRPDALLDQLDPPPLASGGRPIVDVLRPAYLALPDQ